MSSSRRKKRSKSAWTERPVKQYTEYEITSIVDTFVGALTVSDSSQIESFSIMDEPHDEGGYNFKARRRSKRRSASVTGLW